VSYSGSALQWPAYGPLQQPQSNLWYTYVANGETGNNADPLASVAVSVAPSGVGEVTIGGLTVSGDSINVRMIGGVAGRFYIVKLVIVTQSQQTFEALISLPMDRTLAPYPLPVPPNLGFGTATNWP
jgi:hypothetical protein